MGAEEVCCGCNENHWWLRCSYVSPVFALLRKGSTRVIKGNWEGGGRKLQQYGVERGVYH